MDDLNTEKRVHVLLPYIKTIHYAYYTIIFAIKWFNVGFSMLNDVKLLQEKAEQIKIIDTLTKVKIYANTLYYSFLVLPQLFTLF